MINHISIRNFAIIRETEIDFEDGLNIITGETGAGKSIVVQAISLALGSRADSSLVRNGAEKAVVQLAGELDGEEIVITREVSASGRNLCKLNGSIVTLSELSAVCNRLADIHGQYDNQSLLNPENHISLVDSFHQKEIGPLASSYREAYQEYGRAKSELDSLLSKESENLKRADFYRFEKGEIESAKLSEGEDSELESRISLLQNSEKIFAAIETAYSDLNDGDRCITSLMGSDMSSLQSVSEFTPELSQVCEDFSDIYYRLEDVSDSLRNIRESMSFSQDELDSAIERLYMIDGLKKKYGKTIEDILSYYDRISKELDNIENFDEVKAQLSEETEKRFREMSDRAGALSSARKESAAELEKSIEKELHDLNFVNAELSVRFTDAENFRPDGKDLVEIYISTNAGEPLKPLVKTASGGEVSRIMLAIKNITGTYDNIPTMIFDEIDTGISGITASVVGRKLREIADTHQIICITHLPQIAAMGNTNFRIHKESDDVSTFTHVDRLSEDELVEEIARLLGGDNITETTKAGARELIYASK